ncbi:MAG: hypothetical protein AMXMBFR33_01780 [Candidatus Xenobia bacterium]
MRHPYISKRTRLSQEQDNGKSGYLTQPWWRPKRISAFVHSTQNGVYKRAPTDGERAMQRLADQSLQPDLCPCGGIVYAEPELLVNGLRYAVQRCTGCSFRAELRPEVTC